jgi:RNA polymerase sigma-70 factor (ECF subfamily)
MGTPDQTRARQIAAEAEMEAVVATHEQALLRYACGLLGDPHAAQDAVQHAFIKLCDQGFPIRMEPAAVRAWLYRSTHNAAIDHLRREKRHASLHESAALETVPLDPPDPGGDPDRRQMVLDCLRQLAPDEQQVVLLRLQEGMPYKDISETTGLPSGTVGRLLHDAVKKLGTLIQHAGAV